jgi:AraC-like DNA-binding protein
MAIEFPGKKPVQRETLESIALEKHYSVPEVAEMWAMSQKTVRRLFEHEGGVFRWGSEEEILPRRHKRGYCNLRIPESVLIRVHQRRAS